MAAEGDVFIATFNEKNRTVSDDHLTMIFAAVGARHGYKDVGAEFAETCSYKLQKDFYVRGEVYCRPKEIGEHGGINRIEDAR